MKKFLIIFFIVAIASLDRGLAQTDSVYTGNVAKPDSLKKKPVKDREWLDKVSYGGNFQLQLGTYTFIYITPTIGFIPFKNFNFGAGPVYNYISFNYGYPYGRVSQSGFGGHTYARYVFGNLFAQVQYDKLRQPDVFSTRSDAKTWVDYALVGGGFRRPIGLNTGFSVSLMYNLTPSLLSIYYPSRFVLQFGFFGSF